MGVGYKLYRQIRDHAPRDWTSGELVVALMIADSANEGTRRSYIGSSELCRRARMTDRGVRKALGKLAEKGFEFRVIIAKDGNGKELYGTPGKHAEYQVPDIFMMLERGAAVAYGLVDKLAEGGTTVPPQTGLSTERRRYQGSAKAVPQFRLGRSCALILNLKPTKPPQQPDEGTGPHTYSWKHASARQRDIHRESQMAASTKTMTILTCDCCGKQRDNVELGVEPGAMVLRLALQQQAGWYFAQAMVPRPERCNVRRQWDFCGECGVPDRLETTVEGTRFSCKRDLKVTLVGGIAIYGGEVDPT